MYSSETVSLARPLARREANTLRPLAVAILERKPCLFFLFLLEGWNVLFIFFYIYLLLSSVCDSGCKVKFFFWINKCNHFFLVIFYCALGSSENSAFIHIAEIGLSAINGYFSHKLSRFSQITCCSFRVSFQISYFSAFGVGFRQSRG